MKKSAVDVLYAWVIRRRNPIVRAFFGVYMLQLIILVIGGWATYT